MTRLNFKARLDICFSAKLYNSICENSRNKKIKFFPKTIEKILNSHNDAYDNYSSLLVYAYFLS